MAEERIAFELAVEGADKSVADFAKTEKSIKSLDDASKKSAKTFGDLGDVSDKVGRALGSLSPSFASLANQLDDTGKAVVALTTFIGGPAGLAVGGVVAAFAAWQAIASDTSSELNRVAESTNRVRIALGDFEAANKSLKDYQRQIQMLQEGGAGSASVLEAELTRLQFEDFGRAGGGRNAAEIARVQKLLDAERARMQAELDAASAPKQAAQKRMTRGSSSAPTSNEPTLDDLMTQAQGGRFGDVAGIADKSAAELEKANKLRMDEELRAYREAADEKKRIDEERAAHLQELEDEMLRQQQVRNEILISGAQAVGGSLISAMQAAAKGQKVTGKQIVATIGDELVARGTGFLFEGLAMVTRSYGLDPAGYTMMGYGSAAIAAGIGMGAMGAGGAPMSASAGGGRPSEPMLTGSPYQRDSGRSTHVVVNVSTLKADADLGRHVKQAVREADNVYGPGA